MSTPPRSCPPGFDVLLTDELRRRIGEVRVYVAPEPLSRASIRYYALAVRDANPLYTDPDAALSAGWDDVIAPPTLLCDSNQYMSGTPNDDGFLGADWGLLLPGTRPVRGGNDYTFHRPGRPSDRVTVTWRLVDMTERVRANGLALVIVTSQARVTALDGEPILTNVETMVYVEIGEDVG